MVLNLGWSQRHSRISNRNPPLVESLSRFCSGLKTEIVSVDFVLIANLRNTLDDFIVYLQLEMEDLQREANRRWEREQGLKDVTEDMSEDLSEGEKGDALGEPITMDGPRKKFQRNFSNIEVWSDSNKEKKLYIVLIRYTD